VTEWVPEHVKTTRTAYRMEQRQEKYTAYRCEYFPEERTRTVTVHKMVPEVQNVVRTYCVSVPVVEERTVMQAHWTCRPVTKMVCKTVDNGHYECREVPCGPTLRDRLRKLCGKECCDPCPRTKIEKVWVSCPTVIQTPVTTMERVCEHRPVVVRVNTCRLEQRQENVQVTVHRCVAENRVEKFTVNVAKQVPYEAVRTVCVCVPYQEEVTVCRMVACVVEREVAVSTSCGDCCAPSCCTTSCKKSRCCR
jgi:hypothetical protein